MAGKNDYDLMHYEIKGDGPVMILLHGMSTSHKDWRLLWPELVKAGYRVVLADLLGHGDSAKPADAHLYTTKAVFAVLADWIDYLGLSEPFVLVGHSLGGYMSLMYALRYPQRVRKMILLNPLYSLEQLSPALNSMMPLNYMGVKMLESVPYWVVRSFLSRNDTFLTKLDQDVRDQYAADIKRANPNFIRIPADAEDMTPLLPKIPVPTLVIYGLEDHLEYPDSFPRLVEGLPNGSGVPVPGCGHHPHLGQPDLVRMLALKFLNGAG